MGSRSNSIPRKSGEQMIPGITEEDEEEEDEELDDMEVEDVDQFGPELGATMVPSDVNANLDGDSAGLSTAPVSPMDPLTPPEKPDPLANGGPTASGEQERKASSSGGIPLTAEALAKNQRVVEEKEREASVS